MSNHNQNDEDNISNLNQGVSCKDNGALAVIIKGIRRDLNITDGVLHAKIKSYLNAHYNGDTKAMNNAQGSLYRNFSSGEITWSGFLTNLRILGVHHTSIKFELTFTDKNRSTENYRQTSHSFNIVTMSSEDVRLYNQKQEELGVYRDMTEEDYRELEQLIASRTQTQEHESIQTSIDSKTKGKSKKTTAREQNHE